MKLKLREVIAEMTTDELKQFIMDCKKELKRRLRNK